MKKINLPDQRPDADPMYALDSVGMPYWMSVLAGLPVTLCMAIMGLPDLETGFAANFRALYLGTFLFWIFPLAYIQRQLWLGRRSWFLVSVILLVASYCMSVFNNVLGNVLAVRLGVIKSIEWTRLFSGLDSCWLALIAYCAIHAVLIYYFALAREKERTANALALARDAQLRALRYQIHPHFLFNTLNAISSLVVNERNREANRMIADLGDFLRATLEGDECHEHALADELALMDSYLNIEKARLGNRLSVSVHIGPDALQAYVPYLLLQPLVENAIRHGIAPLSAGGKIELSIEHVRDQLQICLKNDVATSESTVSTGHGLGLRNVMERLENLYADRQRFTAKCEGDGQYFVKITIPYRAVMQAEQAWNKVA